MKEESVKKVKRIAVQETAMTERAPIVLAQVVHALDTLGAENRRRVIYAAAIFFGVMPVTEEIIRPDREARR